MKGQGVLFPVKTAPKDFWHCGKRAIFGESVEGERTIETPILCCQCGVLIGNESERKDL